MRVIAQTLARLADTDPIQTTDHLRSCRLPTHSPMERQHFIELFFQRMQWVK
ncbi:Uncharacterised protein [Salmonella enterica subsp. enterica]|uniref:Uncharacterized protein n=1 Tax=Salmonella enterica I TaxID=59201 RepID=A0A447N7H5_SALET|nr:Uncharacterised protein [Salmonella enterica subsp. enterica]